MIIVLGLIILGLFLLSRQKSNPIIESIIQPVQAEKIIPNNEIIGPNLVPTGMTQSIKSSPSIITPTSKTFNLNKTFTNLAFTGSGWVKVDKPFIRPKYNY